MPCLVISSIAGNITHRPAVVVRGVCDGCGSVVVLLGVGGKPHHPFVALSASGLHGRVP